jgi:hypothetical protein
MIKRLNFTGRRRIPRNRVTIQLHTGQPRTFDAAIDLEELGFPPHAAVYLEATSAGSTIVRRFDFGEVEHIRPPYDRTLDDLEGENVFFTLKVVDRTERFGRILGIAEHIRPPTAGDDPAQARRGILPIQPVDLGQQLWSVQLREFGPCLLINKDVPGLVDRAHSDPAFYAVVYPAVLRHCLLAAIAENADPEEEEDRWPVLWLRFGKDLHPERQAPPRSDDPVEDRDAWVDEVVEAFCERHQLKDRYLRAALDEGAEP